MNNDWGWNWLLFSHSQITYNLSAYQKKTNSFYQELNAPLLGGVVLRIKVGELLRKLWEEWSQEGKLAPGSTRGAKVK